MHKVDSFGATPANEFQNPSPGVAGTYLEAKYMNTLQRELTALVTRCGVALTDTDDEQLSERLVLTVANLAALRACPVAGVNRFFVILVRGSATQGDGGGSAYYWSNTATGADDGLDTIVPATAPATGRWKRSALLGTGTTATFAANQPPETNNTLIANTAFVHTKFAALIASSPATLDTLNELASALGNDPNFATTIANLIGLKAPLASPAFTGSPSAPTPALGTNSTVLPTTAFVQSTVQAAITALLASPAFTGVPTGPTAAPGTNTTQLATTAFAHALFALLTTPRGAWVRNTAVIVANNNTLTPLSFGASQYNYDTVWSGANPTRLTVPSGVSRVKLSGSAIYTFNSVSSTPLQHLTLTKNGAAMVPDVRNTHTAGVTATGSSIAVCSPIIEVTPGDYFEFEFSQQSGATISIQPGFAWAALEVIG